jgi:aspartate aminotransferase-like enzyme
MQGQGREPFLKDRLFCPGPTPVPTAAQVAAIMDASVYHRTKPFYDTVLHCRELLRPMFGAKNAPLILTSSGTGAMEAAVTNLTARGDEVLCVSAGKFGERWGKLTEAYECKASILEVEWGKAPTPAMFTDHLKRNPGTKAVFIHANETSTGVFFPLKEIAAAIRAVSDCLLVVDAISALGAHKIEMDAWGIDCIVAGSQKGFGIPPGLAFISLSDKAWERLSKRPRFYFDLARENKNQSTGATAWTPATTLIASLRVSLEELHKYGLDSVADFHRSNAEAVRAGAVSLGLGLLAETDYSHALTAIRLPDDMDGKALVKRLSRDYGAIFAGGQDRLEGKIVRFAHLGFIDRFDVIAGMAALEFALKDEGHLNVPGVGVSRLMESMGFTMGAGK